MWYDNCDVFCSLLPLGSSGHKKKTGAQKETREGRGSSLTPRVSPSRVPVLSFAQYFQAPATQAKYFALTQSALYVLKPRFAPPTPKKRKNIIENHGELKESHFEISHSISPSNNQGHPTTVSSQETIKGTERASPIYTLLHR